MTILNLEMIEKASRKLVILSLLFLMSDEVLDSLLWLTYGLADFIEYSVEMGAENMLNTSDKQTEIIGFYLMLSASLYGAYRLFRALPHHYCQFKTRVKTSWMNPQQYSLVRWHMLSLIGKIELVTICMISSIPFWFLI